MLKDKLIVRRVAFFGQVRTCPNAFGTFSATSDPEPNVGSSPLPELMTGLANWVPSGSNLSSGPDYGSTNQGSF